MAYDASTSKFNLQVYGDRSKKLGRKTIIYGMFGSGKTSLAATWPNPLFFDTDFGENTTLVEKKIPFIRPERGKTYESLSLLINNWLSGKDIFDPDGGPASDRQTLIIDTWTKLNMSILEDAAKAAGRNLADVKATFSDWGLLRSRQFSIMDFLTTLCEFKGIDIVITAQPQVLGDEMEEARKSAEDDGYNQVVGMPSLIGGYKRSFGADVSEMYYLEVLQGAQQVRKLWTVPHNAYYAKTRIGLPAFIDSPSYEKIKSLSKI